MNVQTYARAAGVLFLVTIVAGFFGELYIPTKLIVSGDAAATAANFTGSPSLFRLSFAAYLVEAVCDVALAWLLFVLLRPVNRNLALLTVLFGVVSTATFAGSQLFYAGVSLILSGSPLTSFPPEQVNDLAMLSLKFYGFGAGAYMVFYGLATLIRGYLIFRSEFLPRFPGALMMLAGLGFVTRSFLVVVAPDYASDLILAPMFVAMITLTAWLLVKGVNVPKWEAANVASRVV